MRRIPDKSSKFPLINISGPIEGFYPALYISIHLRVSTDQYQWPH